MTCFMCIALTGCFLLILSSWYPQIHLCSEPPLPSRAPSLRDWYQSGPPATLWFEMVNTKVLHQYRRILHPSFISTHKLVSLKATYVSFSFDQKDTNWIRVLDTAIQGFKNPHTRSYHKITPPPMTIVKYIEIASNLICRLGLLTGQRKLIGTKNHKPYETTFYFFKYWGQT